MNTTPELSQNITEDPAYIQMQIDKRRIVALGRGALRQKNPETGEHETASEHYIHHMKAWITKEQAQQLPTTFEGTHSLETFERNVLSVIRKLDEE